LYAEAARPGGKLVEAVDESATGSVYSFPSIARSATGSGRWGFVIPSESPLIAPTTGSIAVPAVLQRMP
jgi:hypothetical protein